MSAAGAAALPPPLNPDATYLTPLGRHCRLVQLGMRGSAAQQFAQFSYVRRDGQGVMAHEGFWLTRENWRLLTEVNACGQRV